MSRRLVGLLLVLLVAWGGLAAIIYAGLTPLLGLDLQGGTAVVLTAPEGTDPELLEVATEIMARRIEEIGAVQEPDIQVEGQNTVIVQLPGVEDEQRAIDAVGQTGVLAFRPVLDAVPGTTGPLAGTGTENIDDATGLTIDDDLEANSWLAYEAIPEVLEVGPAGLEGGDVADAVPVFDPTSAVWAVSLDLTSVGADAFAALTAEAASYPIGDPRRQIAIALDSAVVAAPAVNPDVSPETGITGGQAQITLGQGDEAQEEANELAIVLRYGSLPVDFEVSAVRKVSGTLGADSLQAGTIAGLVGIVLVAVVLLLAYRGLGLLAIVGLTVFAALLISIFGLFGEWVGLTLTLAGVTGIIVSIGITADTYIVYFERIKEKLRQGFGVEEATADGFKIAFRTMVTANTVSLLGAVLLWALAVGAVKGFAISLGIGTVLDLIVARLYTRRAAGLFAHTRLGKGGWLSISKAAR